MENRTDLSKFNNDWYSPGKSLIFRVLWYIINGFIFNSYWVPLSPLKRVLLRMFGAEVGKNVTLKPKINIKYPWKLKIGENTWIGECVWIDNLDEVVIGANACISQGALLLTGNHHYKKSSFDLIIRPITVKDGAWVGAKTTVTQGVVIGDHSVLTVGSVASKNLKPWGIYAGNPAEFLRERVIKE